MPNPTVSPNMTLILPVPGVDPGPEWATLLYNALNNNIDSHNHSNGQGVQIQPSGLNISADLTFQGNNATNVASLVLGTAPASLINQSVYSSGGDLYYRNSGGTSVQITLGNAVNATSSGITGAGGASAAFNNSGVLIVQSTSTLPGNVNIASLLLGLNSTSVNRLTLSPPSALSAASYGLVLPALPSTASTLYLDTSGNIKTSAAPTVSSSSGNFSTSSTGVSAVTNLSITVTTSGRPVMVGLVSDSTSNASFIGATNTSGSPTSARFLINRGSTVIATHAITLEAGNVTGYGTFTPSSSVSHLDVVAAGTYTYSLTVNNTLPSTNTISVAFACLYAYEV